MLASLPGLPYVNFKPGLTYIGEKRKLRHLINNQEKQWRIIIVKATKLAKHAEQMERSQYHEKHENQVRKNSSLSNIFIILQTCPCL